MTATPVDPLRQLSAPLERLLTCGGDTRLRLDPASQLNAYGCRPFPRPEAFTFASSTATSISDRAYAAVAAARQDLLRDSAAMGFERAFDAHMSALRDDLETQLDLRDTGCAVVFSPSGTDSQLHAISVTRALLGAPLVSVITAADETGSGTAFVACGRHFNDMTAQGVAVAKGGPIVGLTEGTESIAVPSRDERGTLRSSDEIGGDITRAIAGSVAAGKRVLLFAMDRSKLGLRSPSLDVLRWIAATSSDDVQVVVDACQARVGRKRLRWYLERGFMVLLTGSKFFTGAPFSGALLLPPKLVERYRGIDGLAPGMGDYTNRSDWPVTLPGLRIALPARANLGQWSRWVSALEEMRAYFAVPASFRELALAQFAEVVPRLIDREDCLQPLLLEKEMPDEIDDEEMAIRTIFPFFVRHGSGKLLTQSQTVKLYHALNDDVSPLLPATLPAMQRLLAARRCHIGQPVGVADGRGNTVGALRIGAGARFVSEAWRGDAVSARENLRAEFDQVRAILEKIRLLVRHFEEIEPAYDRPGARVPYQVSAA